ncbi:ABC transporter ATP-binding protein [Tenggerimyces flavus]|uniref:ABC transporter ATP-binding protein n=1 Tax=Tenggerimyces flavus TaxID=1708749 RepID=A0ABV7YAR7_9ACTN|nr:ABC transporter ATP-binding protein [Tenggerimyces flavus]MBM7785524.1 peptide/nickel transport system ATP-binding protein [Tenggerimyces flavus]
MAEAATTSTKLELAEDTVVSIRDLHVEFPTVIGRVRALNGVSYDVPRGKVLGIVGESGCGKSVTARAIMQIIEKPGKITGGEILFRPGRVERTAGKRARGTGTEAPANGNGDAKLVDQHDIREDIPELARSGIIDLTTLDPHGPQMRAIRGQEIAMIFQEPMTSLNPVYTVGDQIREAILLHQTKDKDEADRRAVDMLRRVGMPNPPRVAKSYPHQLSGGMRQRAMIAMALSCIPTLLIADEPTTALDVTTEAQILELMRELQAEFGMSIMFITHSMGVVAQLCDEVVVMYLGRVVERASVDDLFYNPKHPYTISLLRSIPRIGVSRHQPLEVIKGSVPDPYSTVTGCPFHPRCPSVMPGLCDTVMPLETAVEGTGHTARCHLYPGSTPADVSSAATAEAAPVAVDGSKDGSADGSADVERGDS